VRTSSVATVTLRRCGEDEDVSSPETPLLESVFCRVLIQRGTASDFLLHSQRVLQFLLCLSVQKISRRRIPQTSKSMLADRLATMGLPKNANIWDLRYHCHVELS
jgi:hypothetical protein